MADVSRHGPPEQGERIAYTLLTYRLDDLNDRHGKVTIFDAGANAGQVTLDRSTWLALREGGRHLGPEELGAGQGGAA